MNARRALTLAPLQIAQALVGLGAIAAFTRLMSPEEFGRYALVLSASMLAHTLLFTWAEAAAFRFFAAARAEKRLADHFATLLALAVALGAIVLVATGALLAFVGVREDVAALSAFAAGAAVFRFLTRITRESDRAAFDISRYAALETAYLAVGFAAGVALLMRFDLGAIAPFAGLLLAGAVIFLIDAPRLLKRAKGGAPSLDRATTYASYGAPLALALALDLGVQTIARFILAHQSGVADLGAYAAAFGLARPLDLIFLGAGAAFAPLMLAAYEDKGADAARDVARKTFAVLAALVIPAAAGLALVAQPLSALLVGDGLCDTAARTLPWLALGGVAAGFNLYYLSEAFQLTRRTGLRAAVMVAPGVVQLVLTLLWTSTFGAIGAAMAAAAGAITGTILLALIGRRLIALPMSWRLLAKVSAATALMSAAVIATPAYPGLFGLVVKVSVGAAAYLAAAIALNILGVRVRAAAALRNTSRAFAQTAFMERVNVRRT
ncbi:lipopolysaccharide biosynthesis protein [Terricaulis silvestris]|uniref:Polysaccharide biosynthesis protein n=1 Tax=Terricaulis silvestris TaxID=2686094 RepID=A0A6I6MSY1_9CAUL|nr:polysaccharide biosynthesis C-terminal domain-containing protein [Terricaulis silvestris]QGZ94782.1 Polysaccharide biosynthesis protein [Terricaulis silvestris]